MSNFLGEYLYILQLHEDVLSGNNVYKFGRTSQEPSKRMASGYPKDSRLWMIVIIQNSKYHETILKRMFKQKYKQHKSDKGDEYYEVDNIQDMMDDLWNYHKQHFQNVYSPPEFNGNYYMAMRKNEIVEFDDKYAFIKMSHLLCCSQFVLYLLTNGWIHDKDKKIMKMKKEDYDKYIFNLNLNECNECNEMREVKSESNNDSIKESNESNNDSIKESNESNNNDSIKESRECNNNDSIKESRECNNNDSIKESRETREVKSENHKCNNDSTKRSNETRESKRIQPTKTVSVATKTTKRLLPITIEHYVKLLNPYLMVSKISPKNASLEINLQLSNNNTRELAIISAKLLSKGKLYKEYSDMSDLEVLIPRNENPNILRLTPRKELIFSQVYSKNITQYVLNIPTLEFKISKGRRGKCEYLDVEFEAIDQF